MRYLDDLDEIEGMLIRAVRSEGNIRNSDARELGMVIDMIKDIAEAKKCTLEACYYESRSDEGMRLGYSRSGRGRGSGGRGGYSGSGRRGYSGRQDGQAMMDEMREILRSGDKAEKDSLREELKSLLDEA